MKNIETSNSNDGSDQTKTSFLEKGSMPLAAAVIYGACLAHRDKITHTQIASAVNTSLVTLINRFLDVKEAFPSLPIGPKDKKP